MTLHDNQYSLSLLRHGSCGYNCDINWSPQVSFFITTPVSRRRRSLRAASFDDYKDIALTSGGQAIRVSKSELSQATDIILDTSTSALVWFYSSVNIMRLIWLDYCLKNRDRRVSRSFFPPFPQFCQVTVLQRARNPGTQETFPFTLDESLKNITIYITGRSITFTLTNPAGTSHFQTFPCFTQPISTNVIAKYPLVIMDVKHFQV